MRLSTVLEAQRQANPGMRLYDLVQERQRQELDRIWVKAHAAEHAAKERFLAELTWVVSQTRPVLRASESSGYFTITFESPDGDSRNAELDVHIGPDQGHHYHGSFVQVRLDGKRWTGMVHRRMQISPNETPVQIWARVRHYFLLEVDEEVVLYESELQAA
jgi:hypothetical protein